MKQMKLRMKFSAMPLAGLLITFALISPAQSELLDNGTFTGGMTGWTVAGSNTEWADTKGAVPGLHSSFEDGLTDGEGYFWYTANNTPGATIEQTVTHTTGAFSLSAEFQQRDDAGVPSSHSFASFSFELLDGSSNPIDTDSETGTFPPDSLLNDGGVPGTPDPAVTMTRTYDNLAAGIYTVQITIAGGQGAVDNVSAIPEPATLGMVAAFGGAILFIRRRKLMM